jgi:hypothetical protein
MNYYVRDTVISSKKALGTKQLDFLFTNLQDSVYTFYIYPMEAKT